MPRRSKAKPTFARCSGDRLALGVNSRAASTSSLAIRRRPETTRSALIEQAAMRGDDFGPATVKKKKFLDLSHFLAHSWRSAGEFAASPIKVDHLKPTLGLLFLALT